jgi:hypothetical protein
VGALERGGHVRGCASPPSLCADPAQRPVRWADTDGGRGQCEVHFEARGRGRKELEVGASPSKMVLGRVPRVSRLLALAHRLEQLLRTGVVKDYTEAARLGHVTRARISQIMSLLYLAPDIQEMILFLPRIERGRDPVVLHELLPIAGAPDWAKQRRLWRRLGEAFGWAGRHAPGDRPRVMFGG